MAPKQAFIVLCSNLYKSGIRDCNRNIEKEQLIQMGGSDDLVRDEVLDNVACKLRPNILVGVIW